MLAICPGFWLGATLLGHQGSCNALYALTTITPAWVLFYAAAAGLPGPGLAVVVFGRVGCFAAVSIDVI